MKSWAFLITILAASTMLLGCTPKNSADEDYQRKLKEHLDEIERQAEETIAKAKLDVEALNKLHSQGGLPGTIFLSDALLVEGSDAIMPDPRIHTRLQAGIGQDGKSTAFTLAQFIKRQDVAEPVVKSIEAAALKKTYINLNCPSLDPSAIEGLKPAKMKIRKWLAEASATKIFLCGKKRTHYNIGFLNAQEIIMQDADYELKGGINKWMVLQAETLTLIGQNRLAISGIESKEPWLQPAGSFSFSILKPLETDGSLLLQTTGASYQAPGSVPK